MNTFADSISSSALGAVVIAAAWLVKHDGQLKSLLNLLPSLAKDAATARTAVEQNGVAPIVHKVESVIDEEGKQLLRAVLTRLAAQEQPMAEPPTTDPTPAPATEDTAPEPATATVPGPVAAPAGLAEGTVTIVRGGQLIPQTS